MASKDQVIALHSVVSEVADSVLTDYSREDVQRRVEEDGIEVEYSLLPDKSKGDFVKSTFGISYALSKLYPEQNEELDDWDELFFDRRAEDFEEFIRNDDEFYKTRHYIQLAELYSEIANQEEVEFEDRSTEVNLSNYLLISNGPDYFGEVHGFLNELADTLEEQEDRLIAD